MIKVSVFLSISFFCVCSLFADSVVLPTEKYEQLPSLPPLTTDLVKKESEQQEKSVLSKIEKIFKKELERKSKKKPKVEKRKNREHTEKLTATKRDKVSESVDYKKIWGTLKDPPLEKIIRDLLDDQYKDFESPDRKISLSLRRVDIKKAFEALGKIGGVQIVVDSDVEGIIENLDLKNTPFVFALKLMVSSNDPQLAVLSSRGTLRITKLSTAVEFLKPIAMDMIERDYKGDCITVFYAKWNDNLKKRLERLWKGIIGETKEKGKSYLVFDDESKKILCWARKAQIEIFKDFIRKIDVEIPQVKIDVRVMIANKDFEESLGFDWSGYYDKRTTVKRTEFMGFGAKKNDTDDTFFNNAVNWSMNFVPTLSIIGKALPIRLPFIWGNKDLESNRLNLILQAAETRNEVRTVLKPSLLVNNDEWSEILVGEEMPHETRIAETVEGQPSNITTTQYKDIGMKIKIKSIVSPDKHSVFLDIFIESSYIARPKFPIETLPSIQTRGFNYTIETSRSQNRVFLKNGQTTMIGGLIMNSQERVRTGVPFLQEIPFLGWIFQGRRKAVVEKQLIIFITPTVV